MSLQRFILDTIKTIKTDIENHNKRILYQTIFNSRSSFHDRFLIIDDVVYHVGASVKIWEKKLMCSDKVNELTPRSHR